jgi:hypothetical protein
MHLLYFVHVRVVVNRGQETEEAYKYSTFKTRSIP